MCETDREDSYKCFISQKFLSIASNPQSVLDALEKAVLVETQGNPSGIAQEIAVGSNIRDRFFCC